MRTTDHVAAGDTGPDHDADVAPAAICTPSRRSTTFEIPESAEYSTVVQPAGRFCEDTFWADGAFVISGGGLVGAGVAGGDVTGGLVDTCGAIVTTTTAGRVIADTVVVVVLVDVEDVLVDELLEVLLDDELDDVRAESTLVTSTDTELPVAAPAPSAR